VTGSQVLETKLTLDGRTQTFTCAGLLVSPRQAVVRFDHTGERRAGGFFFPAGSHTLGFFWRSRPYNCYRIAGPDGAVIAHRFDVVDRVSIAPGSVRYRDLLLDVWVGPSGGARVEDEEEVDEARRQGLLTAAMIRRIERTRSFLLGAHPRIVAEVEQIAEMLAPAVKDAD
jgi:hypothetical protein